jgi:hypothetical protein
MAFGAATMLLDIRHKIFDYSSVDGAGEQYFRIPTILAASRVIQRFRFHLIFGACFGVAIVVANLLLTEALISTSTTWTHSTSWLLKTCCRSSIAVLGIIQIFPSIGRTLSGSEAVYWSLLFGQCFITGFGVSFLFRSRHWFFNSTILFWLLFPLAFVPLILPSSGIKYWCGFGIGQPWEWLYYCENVGATFFSLTALFGELAIGLAGVILVWQLAKFVFGKGVPEIKPNT